MLIMGACAYISDNIISAFHGPRCKNTYSLIQTIQVYTVHVATDRRGSVNSLLLLLYEALQLQAFLLADNSLLLQ